ncbi:hypothetical protein H6501_01520 [Candidatus Woesearchaeota archaeon]|nr:hypothetical protein [Candidatus Woesearchaeota archaeon]
MSKINFLDCLKPTKIKVLLLLVYSFIYYLFISYLSYINYNKSDSSCQLVRECFVIPISFIEYNLSVFPFDASIFSHHLSFFIFLTLGFLLLGYFLTGSILYFYLKIKGQGTKNEN